MEAASLDLVRTAPAERPRAALALSDLDLYSAQVARQRARLSTEDFLCDSHAARYRDQLDAHPDATAHLLDILNDPTNEQRLLDAEHHDLPALTGVVRFIERDPLLSPILAREAGSARFRQTIGVAIKLKMRQLGWAPTGRKGSVRNADYFTKAERYTPAAPSPSDYRERALAGLDALATIGDPGERARTGDELLDNLATARAHEGRPF